MTMDKGPEGIVHAVAMGHTIAVCGARTTGAWDDHLTVTCVSCMGTPLRRQCGHSGASLYPCPYASEVRGTKEFCECCEECSEACAADV